MKTTKDGTMESVSSNRDAPPAEKIAVTNTIIMFKCIINLVYSHNA